jgi:hypothetical protein
MSELCGAFMALVNGGPGAMYCNAAKGHEGPHSFTFDSYISNAAALAEKPAERPAPQAETPAQLVEWLGGSSRANSVEHVHQRDLAIRREAEQVGQQKMRDMGFAHPADVSAMILDTAKRAERAAFEKAATAVGQVPFTSTPNTNSLRHPLDVRNDAVEAILALAQPAQPVSGASAQPEKGENAK